MMRKGSRGKRPTVAEEALRALDGKPGQGPASPAPASPQQRSVASIFSAPQARVVFSDSGQQDSGASESVQPAAKAGALRQAQPDVTVRKPVDEVLLARSGTLEEVPGAGTSEATQNVSQEDIISEAATPPPIPAPSGQENGKTVMRKPTPDEMAQKLPALEREMYLLNEKLKLLESSRAYKGDLQETNKDISKLVEAMRTLRDGLDELKKQANVTLDIGKTLPHVKQSDIERKRMAAALDESLYDALLKTPVGNEEVAKRFRKALREAVEKLPDIKIGKFKLKDAILGVIDKSLMPMMQQMAYHVDVFRNITREVLVHVGRLDDERVKMDGRIRALEGKFPKGE